MLAAALKHPHSTLQRDCEINSKPVPKLRRYKSLSFYLSHINIPTASSEIRISLVQNSETQNKTEGSLPQTTCSPKNNQQKACSCAVFKCIHKFFSNPSSKCGTPVSQLLQSPYDFTRDQGSARARPMTPELLHKRHALPSSLALICSLLGKPKAALGTQDAMERSGEKKLKLSELYMKPWWRHLILQPQA